MSGGDRAINYASMFIGGAVGMTVGLVIYRRTMARAAELAAEEGFDGEDGDIIPEDEEGIDGEYADGENSRLVRSGGDVDAAALMDDDDISLWETEGIEGANTYRDSWDEEAAVEGNGKKTNGTTR